MREYLLERDPGVLLVRCGGRLTIEVAGRLKGELDEAFREGGFSVLALDLSKVRFLDSSGIGLMVTLHSRALSRGMRLRLLSPSVEVGKTLDLVRLSDFFDYASSEEGLFGPVD